MRIVWLINTTLPAIAKKINKPSSNGGGWIVGLSNALQREENINLLVCFPADEEVYIAEDVDRFSCYGFKRKSYNSTIYDLNLEIKFLRVIERFHPDIIHIWGTEYPHTLAMVRAAKNAGMIDKVIISIQGLCSVISTHYLSGVPYSEYKRKTLRDIIRNDDMYKQKENFAKRGVYEIEALRNVTHISGRTIWDKACVSQINPQAKYYFCNETLRDDFYEHQWDINKCNKYSIFMSQGSYPVKGLHFVLEAMPLILRKYPDAHLYVAGTDITKNSRLIEKLKISSYGKYTLSLMNKHKLHDHVTFVGEQNEKQMVASYLRAHVFVSPSTIENSSNSIGEAMLLGVPTVASNVGGVSDLLAHNSEGFTYQHDAPYMLAYYVCRLFEDDDLAVKFSRNAREHAIQTHNRKVNLPTILSIYKEIVNC